MKCYDFELNISAYIEGELKQIVRNSFVQHAADCISCKEKLEDINILINDMPKMGHLHTSSNFINNLHSKINEIDNRNPSIWEKLSRFKPFGFDPAPAFGFVFVLGVVISVSLLLLNKDGLPVIDIQKLSSQSQKGSSQNFKPSLVIPPQTEPSIADTDSSTKSHVKKHYDNKIRLTGGK